jgi:hypothetical protein
VSEDKDRLLLRVVAGGEPTPEELAALVVALSAQRQVAGTPAVTGSAWSDHARLLRRPIARGPAAWRWSLR